MVYRILAEMRHFVARLAVKLDLIVYQIFWLCCLVKQSLYPMPSPPSPLALWERDLGASALDGSPGLKQLALVRAEVIGILSNSKFKNLGGISGREGD